MSDFGGPIPPSEFYGPTELDRPTPGVPPSSRVYPPVDESARPCPNLRPHVAHKWQHGEGSSPCPGVRPTSLRALGQYAISRDPSLAPDFSESAQPAPARNGWWADEGGYRFDFECDQHGRLTITMTRPDGPPVTATMASWRAHQFWKWYNHVAPLFEGDYPERDQEPVRETS